jgi:hypothetical protein
MRTTPRRQRRQGGVLAACVVGGVLEFAHAFFQVAFCLVGLSLLFERFIAGRCADALLDLAGDLIHFALDLVISHGSTSRFWRRTIATRLKNTRRAWQSGSPEPNVGNADCLPTDTCHPVRLSPMGGVVQVLDGMFCVLEALAQVTDGGHHGERRYDRQPEVEQAVDDDGE